MEVRVLGYHVIHCDSRLEAAKRYMHSPLRSTFVTTIKNKNEWVIEY